MENKKLKTYVLTLSRVFPKSHKRSGEPTNFGDAFGRTKLHTIRANYLLWYARFQEIAKGAACLSVRQWSGKPYQSKQVEIARLTAEDGIGLQRLDFYDSLDCFEINFTECADVDDLAANDGLSLEDWREWFKGYDITQPMAVIQFTEFRY